MVTSAPSTHDLRPLLPSLAGMSAADAPALCLFGSYASGRPGPAERLDAGLPRTIDYVKTLLAGRVRAP